MKFLCPNCKAKYRIGPEKMVGRQAAKIRCRKCEYLIQISYRGNSDDFDITATPSSMASAAPAPVPAPRQPPKATTGQPVIAAAALPNVSSRPRVAGPSAAPIKDLSIKDEGSGSKKPTAAVPGLPGLGSPKSTRGAALHSDAGALARRPLAPLPPPPAPPLTGAGLALPGAAQLPTGGAAVGAMAPSQPAASPSLASQAALSSPPARSVAGTQLGDQFRESVQAGGAPEDLAGDGWFVGVNGVPLGPIPLGDLRELALAGHIDRRSLVWREGQAEWRPLGKFPGLARVIDDGTAPLSTPRPEPIQAAPPAAPAPSPSNGAANGHIATGFDVARASTGERPSAWGDLDDEDDQDEQPTTVKGRVSVPPNVAPPNRVPRSPPVPSAPPPPVGVPASAGNPFGVTSSVLAVPLGAGSMGAMSTGAMSTGAMSAGAMSAGAMSTGMYRSSMSAPPSAPPFAPEGGGPTSTLSNTPEPVVDVGMDRASGRSRWILIVAAIVFAFALGAIVTHLMRSSSPEKQSKSSAGVESSKQGFVTSPKPYPPLAEAALEHLPPVAEELDATSRTAPAALERARAGAISKTILGALVAPSSAVAPVPSGPKPRPAMTSSLLVGLGDLQVPGPSPGKADEPEAVSGLDATAIQRTVRRYSPGVRQNCWLRALNARAPGVPSSAKVSATITVDALGHVQAVAVSGAPKGYPGLPRCIEGNVKVWQFPPSGTQTVTTVPFMFVGQ
jgi:predicted Zn finger-like uncharacterized protein